MVTFFDIMEFTADRIYNDKQVLPSLLKMFSMFKIKCWYNMGGSERNKAVKIAIRCGNCGKETMIDVDNLNTTYQYKIKTFLLNTMLHHVGMLWIIETHE